MTEGKRICKSCGTNISIKSCQSHSNICRYCEGYGIKHVLVRQTDRSCTTCHVSVPNGCWLEPGSKICGKCEAKNESSF